MNETTRALRWTIVLCLAVAGSAVAPAASAHEPASMSPAHSRTLLIDCSREAVYKPSSYVLACGDGNAALSHLRWTAWSNARAVAAGVFSVNDCQPYCAAGHFHNYATAAVFDRPVRSSKGIAFDRVVLRFSGQAPAGRRTITQDHLVPTI